jgi:hypothetical protein
LFQKRKEKRRNLDQTRGLRPRPPLKEWRGLPAGVAEVLLVDAVAAVEEEVPLVEEEDRPHHFAPWQPEEEWDARKFPCLARNNARNNKIPFVTFFLIKISGR